MPSHTTTTLLSHHGDSSCRQYALFFHGLTPLWSLFTPLIFAIIASVLTHWIRSITPGIDVGIKPSIEVTPPTPSDDVEATAIPDLTTSTESSTEDQPPPYQPPAQDSTPAPAPTSTPTPPKVPRTSAGRFVMGSAIFLSIIASLFFSAVALQALIFCQHWSPVSILPRIIYWTIFIIPSCWATVGACCWLMLLRDLWGPGMRKKFPISETAILYGLTCTLISPFILVGFVLGGGAVKAIEACQRRFCGDALEDEREEIEESVELQEGPRMEVHAESPEGSGSGEEERVGLIAGVEK
ncbi:hypothetical protein N431DRAFT_105847 [Stipitochalara longipes BDJ]|nr:hypothetical protein N431DRAFT_105847 [Stipitochalara longipes BDJ]